MNNQKFNTEIMKEYEYEYGRRFFGDNLFVEPKSTKQVYQEIKNSSDFPLFQAISKIKKLTLEGQWELMAEALQSLERGEEIPEVIREKLILSSLSNVSALAFNYLCKHNTIYTYGDFISEGYLALEKAFDKWLKKTEQEKLQNILDGRDVFANFNTYAFNWIKDAFAVMLSKDTALSISLSSQKKIKKIACYKADFIKKFGRVPSEEELSTFSGYSKKEITGSSIFLERVQTENYEDVELNNIYRILSIDSENKRNEEKLQNLHHSILIDYMKKVLNKVQFEVIKSWYLEEKNLFDISKMLGISVYKTTTIRDEALALLQSKSMLLKSMLG